MNKYINFFKKNIPYLFLLTYLLCICLQIHMTGDDLIFKKQSLSFHFMQQRYYEWSSRILTETFLISILHIPYVIFKAINILIICFLVKWLKQLFWGSENSTVGYAIVIFFWILYPIQAMSSAGWTATIINYLWPMAFCLPSFIIDKKILNKCNPTKKYLIFSLITLVIGTDVEFACVLSLLITLGNFAIIENKKQYLKYYFIKFFVLLCSLTKVILCPGHYTRFVSEVSSWFPDFLTLSIFDKIYLGCISTTSYLLNRTNILFCFLLLLFLLLSYLITIKYSYKIYLIGMLLLKAIGMNALKQDNIWDIFHGGYRITVMNATSLENYISFILSICIITGIPILLWGIYGKTHKFLYLSTWYVAGLSARMILILSPTIYASGVRTFWPLDIALMGILIVICKDIFRKLNQIQFKEKESKQ